MTTLPLRISIIAIVLFTGIRCSEAPAKKEKAPQLRELPAADQEIDGYTLVKNDSLGYQLAVSNELSATTELNAQASLQYGNTKTGQYIILVDEPKADIIEELKSLKAYDSKQSFLDNFASFRIKQLEKNARGVEKGPITKKEANSLNMQSIRLEASVVEVPEKIVYYIGFAEGAASSYMIMAWTLKSGDDAFRPVAEKMIGSFQLTGNPVIP